MLIYEFFRWWAYRRIRHPMMQAYVWTAPLALAGLAVASYALLPIKPALGGADGLLKSLSQILALLPGFFISALAAVATFNRPEMDETMPGDPPRAEIKHRGQKIEIALTRRMFLTYLFSYLSVLSVMLFVVVIGAPYLYPSVEFLAKAFDVTKYIWAPKYVFIVVLAYFLSSLLLTMLHGVYFLCERMHMPNS